MVSGSGFHLVTSLSCLALNFPSVRSWGWGAAGTRGLGSGSASGSLCSQTHPGDDGDHLLSVHVAEQHRLHRHDAAHRQRHPEEPLWPEGGSEGPQLGQRRECRWGCGRGPEATLQGSRMGEGMSKGCRGRQKEALISTYCMPSVFIILIPEN